VRQYNDMLAPLSRPWVQQPVIAGARARLFCFHHAGGHPGIFASWQEYLGTEIEVLPVWLPGSGGRLDEPLITPLSALVAAAEVGLRPYFDRPFCFFGHSMGALLAYELTLRLAGQHVSPLLLCVSGREAPCEDPITCDAPPLALPIIALGGTRDVSVPHAAVGAWSTHTNARFTCHLLPGDHSFYRAHARRICQTIADTLRACELKSLVSS